MAEWRLLSDGEMFLPADALFATAPPDQRGDGADVPYGCLLIRTATDTVLVDAGMGAYEHPLGGHGGNLEAALAAAGVTPRDVSVVIITHSHLDHIGGLCADGRPRFGAARHVMSRVEWDWGTQRESPVADAQLPPLERAGVLELVDPPAEPVPGVRLLAAPGHTPGQLAVEIAGTALFLADAIVDPRHVEHPDWTMAFDEDPDANVRTRRELLGRAADEGLVVAASHLPQAGHVERAGSAFRLVA
jgi:glyoxylase-like metal-dependent hydrolase (beta-lactamase superfamily II)